MKAAQSIAHFRAARTKASELRDHLEAPKGKGMAQEVVDELDKAVEDLFEVASDMGEQAQKLRDIIRDNK